MSQFRKKPKYLLIQSFNVVPLWKGVFKESHLAGKMRI